MSKPALFSAALVVLLGSGLVFAQSPSGTVAETINARRGLMNQLASIQTLIDTRVATGEYSTELYDLSQAAAASLDAFALLFPEESNLLGDAPPIEGVETTATAAVWEDLPAFQKLLYDASTTARTASEASDLDEFSARWTEVAATCTSCHETYVFFDPFAGFN